MYCRTRAWSTAFKSQRPVLPFSRLNNTFFGYFDPEKIYENNENKQFSGWPDRYFGWKNHCSRPTNGDVRVHALAIQTKTWASKSLSVELEKSWDTERMCSRGLGGRLFLGRFSLGDAVQVDDDPQSPLIVHPPPFLPLCAPSALADNGWMRWFCHALSPGAALGASFLAELSVRSPRKLIIFII